MDYTDSPYERFLRAGKKVQPAPVGPTPQWDEDEVVRWFRSEEAVRRGRGDGRAWWWKCQSCKLRGVGADINQAAVGWAEHLSRPRHRECTDDTAAIDRVIAALDRSSSGEQPPPSHHPA